MLKLLAFFLISCTISATVMQEIPTVQTREEFNRHLDQKVNLVGTYTLMMLPASKRPGSRMVQSGRVSINLGDFEVALDRDSQGLRQKDEMKKFSGKKVRVRGKLHKMVALWGSGEEQSIIMPAIMEIESIEKAE